MSNIKKTTTKTKAVKQTKKAQPVKVIRYKARGKYRVVDGIGQTMIEPSSPENRSEDEILDTTKRARLLDLTRNLVRNSSLFNTILG